MFGRDDTRNTMPTIGQESGKFGLRRLGGALGSLFGSLALVCVPYLMVGSAAPVSAAPDPPIVYATVRHSNTGLRQDVITQPGHQAFVTVAPGSVDEHVQHLPAS
jgi:hypothetical protein